MYSWRITKYNPKFRDENGSFINQEWISYYDIGKSFGNYVLTFNDYLEIENAYVSTVLLCMNSLGIAELTAKDLEIYKSLSEIKKDPSDIYVADIIEMYNSLKEGLKLNKYRVDYVCRLILREYVWCKLECNNLFMVHFGYDYYMYICSEYYCVDVLMDVAKKRCLYIEEMDSPYLS